MAWTDKAVVGICALVVAAWIIGKSGDGAGSSAPKESACAAGDLQCLGDKGIVAAGLRCREPVERLALHDTKWTDGTLDTKFTRFRWRDKEASVITFVGDKLMFQNGFGAFSPMVHECDLRLSDNQVLGVRAEPGRLQQ